MPLLADAVVGQHERPVLHVGQAVPHDRLGRSVVVQAREARVAAVVVTTPQHASQRRSLGPWRREADAFQDPEARVGEGRLRDGDLLVLTGSVPLQPGPTEAVGKRASPLVTLPLRAPTSSTTTTTTSSRVRVVVVVVAVLADVQRVVPVHRLAVGFPSQSQAPVA